MTKPAISLSINGLELSVHLGWTEEECQREQIVLLEVDISFSDIPKACATDNLDDTLCYSALITTIREKINNKKFRLIEFLTHELYQIIKAYLPEGSKIMVRLTKYPPIQGLTGGVCFTYTDGD